MTVWLPLFGPNDNGHPPKGCCAKGWNLPEYKGIDPANREWVGLRLDDYIVIDCDDQDAADAWLKHIDQHDKHTFTRKTPHGYHFFYRRTVDVLHVRPQKLLAISPKLELKTGIGHQVVFTAPGYETAVEGHASGYAKFNPSWVPERQDVQVHEEWSEMPEGIGDNSMLSFAGTFRRWGMDENTIKRCLLAVMDVTMTREPMPLSSIRRIARQAAKYEPEDARSVMCPKCGCEVEYR